MSLVFRSEEATGRGRNSIYLGGKVDAKDLPSLRAKSITHILNVTPPKEAGVQAGVPNYFESNKTFVYKRICVYDAPTSDLLSHADEAVKFIASGLCHGSVLVHCQQGVSRSTTCVAFYLMRKEGMTLKGAMKTIWETRPDAQPIPVFMEQLSEYETKCFALGAIQGQPTKKRRITPLGPSRRPLGPDLQPFNAKSKGQKMIGPSIGPSRSETPDPLISPIESAHQLKATQSSPDIGPSWPNNQD